MPQSLHFKYGHIIFSTKNREPSITGDLEPRLFEYMGGIVRGADAHLVEINGTMNHVHLLIRESKSVADQDFMRQLKGDSSRWVNSTVGVQTLFSWQDGYGWFSVSPTDVEAATAYIRGQKEHHKTMTFEEEYRQFLRKYGLNMTNGMCGTDRLRADLQPAAFGRSHTQG
jgi:REP element-mobilizing transposase RayT